jgi:chromatin remodeling complex protein RSC6
MSTAAKNTKRVTKKTEETVAAPVAVVEAPKKAETKAVTKKAETTKKVEAPVVVATPVATTTTINAETPAVVSEEIRLEQEVKAVTSRLLTIREVVSEMITESKKLEKKAAKLQKLADKRRKRKAAAEAGADGKPARISIFQIPNLLTPELCKFMGRPTGSKECRSNVTKHITQYVRDNNLKNKHDINPDAKLKALLNLKDGDKLTYFNLQKYLNVHYVKENKA